jgi:predicted transcriptional regulator
MNFNVYLESEIGAALGRLAKRRKLTRNALIRKAVEDLLNKENHSQEWSEAVLQWQGDPKWVPFESNRARLAPAVEDPLA